MSVLKQMPEKSWPLIMDLIDTVLQENWMDSFTVEMIRYQLEGGGKRIRPAIVLGLHRVFGGEDGKALGFAAAVELIHNASLVHDDIQDQDEYRRGKHAAWKKFTTSQAINLGDVLFATAFEVFMKSDLPEPIKMEIVRLTMRAVGELVNGQVQEIIFRNGAEVTVDNYLSMVGGKTGSLFRLATRGAMVLTGNGSEHNLDDLTSLGSSLGNLFQVRDDIIDIVGLKEGRKAGSDVMEGKISILTSISLAKLDEEGRSELMGLLAAPRDSKDGDVVEKVEKIYRKTGAIEEATAVYRRERERIFSIPLVKNNVSLGSFMSEVADMISLPLDENSVT
ncbi:MAG: polyprenyl synthetase family protein [Pseudomonadota bacterium]